MPPDQEKAVSFLSQMVFQKRGNLRFFLALLDGAKTTVQLREMRIVAHVKMFEYMALIKIEKLDKGVKYELTKKGMAIVNALSGLLLATSDNLPK